MTHEAVTLTTPAASCIPPPAATRAGRQGRVRPNQQVGLIKSVISDQQASLNKVEQMSVDVCVLSLFPHMDQA